MKQPGAAAGVVVRDNADRGRLFCLALERRPRCVATATGQLDSGTT